MGRIVLQSDAWGGCAGSVVLESRGRLVGVVSAIDIGVGYFGQPQLVQNIVLVSPIRELDIDSILSSM